jgi:NAD(P)-dependent dehydrogenase (short-subunit alcohol dehydrogenase family)
MSFSPDKDIPSLAGKVILVTGGNSGLGKESILQLAKHKPRQIIMAARSQSRAKDAMKEIEATVPGTKIDFLALDLSSFESIKKAAASILQQYDRLDVLLNNAGLFGVPPGLTEDGYEMQFGSNHMGPALFTRLLLPLLENTAQLPNSDVRVVQLGSDGYKFAPPGGILFPQLKTEMADVSGRARYAQSKLANMYFIKALAKRHPKMICVALHPGVVNTGILKSTLSNYPSAAWLFNIGIRLFFTDVRTGALGQLWAATGRAEELETGAYYTVLKKRVYGNKLVDDDELAEELWDWTEEQFLSQGLKF